MKAKLEIKIPTVPMHVMFGGDTKIHISHLSEKELRQLDKEWTDLLVQRASEGRSIR